MVPFDIVIFPFAAGCQSIGIYSYKEAERVEPRAVLGFNDISARVYLKRVLRDDLMTFAVVPGLFQEMEDNVQGSFLEQDTWRQLVALADSKKAEGRR